MTTLSVRLGADSYDIRVGRGSADRAAECFDLDRKVLVVTDDGVPPVYAERVAAGCRDGRIAILPQGEANKTFAGIERLCRVMLTDHFTRGDAVVAVGGGLVGDMAGFAAAVYMRGIDFYNIPTTVLAQVDSSVGGKTGVNLDGIKNTVGALWQPRGVIVDPDLTKTLPPRQIANGLAEAVKMALTFDEALFARLEKEEPSAFLDDLILASLKSKIKVVEQDEKEAGLRRVLNFGHTIGHGIESLGLGYYHGECVALGMTAMCSPTVRTRLLPVLKKLGLPTEAAFDREAVLEAVLHDKKAAGGAVRAITVDRPGHWREELMDREALRRRIEETFGKGVKP